MVRFRDSGEPEATIYGPDWRAILRRLHLLGEPTLIKTLRTTLKHLEEGWKTIRPIQLYHEADRHRENMDPVTVAVLYFLEIEVVDRFRGVALELVRALPVKRAQRISTESFDDILAETELIQNYFRLAGLMGRMAEVAEPVRGLAASAGTLEVWAREFERLFSEVDSTVKRLGLDGDDDDPQPTSTAG